MGLGFRICHPDELKKEMDSVDPIQDGFDVIVDCSGNAEAIQQAFYWVKQGGKFNIFGFPTAKATMTINPMEIVSREISVFGSRINCLTYPASIPLVKEMSQKYLTYEHLGIQTFTFDDFEKAFSMLREGSISKAVFKV